jgi:hypothetical protein
MKTRLHIIAGFNYVYYNEEQLIANIPKIKTIFFSSEKTSFFPKMEPKILLRSVMPKKAITISKMYPAYKCEASSYYCAEYGRWNDNSTNYEMLQRLIPNQKTIEMQIKKIQFPSLSYIHTDFIGFISCLFDKEVNVVIGLDQGYKTVSASHYESEVIHQLCFSHWVLLLFFFQSWIIPLQIVLLMKIFCLDLTFNVFSDNVLTWCIITSLCIVYYLDSIFAIFFWSICFIQYLEYYMTNRLIAAVMHKLVKHETIRIENDNLIIL